MHRPPDPARGLELEPPSLPRLRALQEVEASVLLLLLAIVYRETLNWVWERLWLLQGVVQAAESKVA
jgi:hypothetical protein